MANLAKKKGDKSTALAKPGQWKEELKKYAQETSAKEQMPGGSFISFRGGVIKVAGTAIKGNTIKVLVLDSVYENVCYKGDFDPDSPASPICFAMGDDDKLLAPHAKVKKPFTILLPDDDGEFAEQEVDSETCADCPANKYGTAQKKNGEQGKGKKCKNTRRLAVISANQLTESAIKNGEVFYLKVPVTSCKAWSQYVKALNAELQLPYFGVVTTITLEPDEENQISVSFSDPEPVSEELIETLLARREAQIDLTQFPYPEYEEPEEKPKKATKGAAAKSKPAKGGPARGKGKF